MIPVTLMTTMVMINNTDQNNDDDDDNNQNHQHQKSTSDVGQEPLPHTQTTRAFHRL